MGFSHNMAESSCAWGTAVVMSGASFYSRAPDIKKKEQPESKPTSSMCDDECEDVDNTSSDSDAPRACSVRKVVVVLFRWVLALSIMGAMAWAMYADELDEGGGEGGEGGGRKWNTTVTTTSTPWWSLSFEW